jgi:ring-1,2-phenylacetyl-CoA epoxidase subunit PaaD
MITEQEILTNLKEVKDPEIPTLSIVDLGIVTNVSCSDNHINISLTPTFAGCPALRVIEDDVRDRIIECYPGYEVEVKTTFEVPWTTDMITEEGKQALLKHGLAPPNKSLDKDGMIELDVLSDVACPNCGSRNTTLKSPFGPTLCRSIHHCKNCLEAFEAFKPVG